MSESSPASGHEGGVLCPSCERTVRIEDVKPCAICRRRVCHACLRPYGHHMLACEECRLEAW